MTRTLRIATLGVAHDYQQSLVPMIIQSLGYEIAWVPANKAHLVVIGPFHNLCARQRWVPRPLRPAHDALVKLLSKPHRPLTLFQTGENLRHDHFPHDYALSFDLAVNDPKHHRFPYWMEMVDWSHEGITGNINPRFGSLIKLERLMQPLGKRFLQKPRKAAIFASHIREPRATLIHCLQSHMEVQGFGSVFDATVVHHSKSNFTKLDVLADFGFNLCPENSMYPGYYTEKIPEAFMADCLPITWADSNVSVDFNPAAMLNLAPMTVGNFKLLNDLLSPVALANYASQPLLLQAPTLDGLTRILGSMLSDAVS